MIAYNLVVLVRLAIIKIRPSHTSELLWYLCELTPYPRTSPIGFVDWIDFGGLVGILQNGLSAVTSLYYTFSSYFFETEL